MAGVSGRYLNLLDGEENFCSTPSSGLPTCFSFDTDRENNNLNIFSKMETMENKSWIKRNILFQ